MTKQQLQTELAQVQSKALELQKQIDTFVEPVFVFGKGDFGTNSDGSVYYTSITNIHMDKWTRSFYFLAYHCLSLGGRVMSKPNDGQCWYALCFSYRKNDFYIYNPNDNVAELFNFPSRELCEQFLFTEGVKENWLLFMQVDTEKK